jgi:K+-sensing histidine kinase KdpD
MPSVNKMLKTPMKRVNIKVFLSALTESFTVIFLLIIAVEALKFFFPLTIIFTTSENISILLLIGIIICALRQGMIGGMFATAFSFLGNSFFFTFPYYSFRILDISETLNLILLVISGILVTVIGNSARSHHHEVAAGRDKDVHEAREKMRSAMLSAVSHDLKTPLSSVIGALDVYQEISSRLPEERKLELIRTALSEARRLDQLINNILDMAKLENNGIQYRFEETDIRLIAQNALQKTQNKFKNRKIQFEAEGDNWETRADPGMLERAIIQLLDNAVKYTAEDNRIILRMESHTHSILITVQDNGAGIPAHQQEAVFDKYTRLNQGDHKIAGTGLGLPIARQIAEDHGGTLLLKPSNHGAHFEISIPR